MHALADLSGHRVPARTKAFAAWERFKRAIQSTDANSRASRTRYVLAAPSCLNLTIAAGSCVCLIDAPGARLLCDAGALWITECGSHPDITLEAGQQATVRQRGKTVILAVRESVLRIEGGNAKLPHGQADVEPIYGSTD